MLIGLIFNLSLVQQSIISSSTLMYKQNKLKILDTCLYHLKLLFIYFSFYFPLNQVLISAGVENWGTPEINESHGTNT